MKKKGGGIDVEYLARLARIDIGPDEAKKLEEELATILSYVEEIQGISGGTKEQKPDLRNVLREDTDPYESGKFKESLLREAPQKEGDFFKVKKIL